MGSAAAAAAADQPRGILTSAILGLISVLDSYGAATWNLRSVALVSALCLYFVYRIARYTTPDGKHEKVGNVCWEGLVHAVISGVGSAMCVHLNHFAAVDISGTAEPLRSIQCGGGPLTSLHRILPAITLGYGICDILEGLDLGRDFLIHATSLVVVMGSCCELGYSHCVTPMLIMELSSVWLNLASATFLAEYLSVVCQLLFAATFFVVRILVVPYIWLEWVLTYLKVEGQGGEVCFPRYFFYIVIVFGVIFHGLNFYWMYKIIRKIKRKMAGNEKMVEAELKNR